jgi:UDP-2-acetamido-3-amino-2,3-dideoxy-glucuronate N-acetyltransferase
MTTLMTVEPQQLTPELIDIPRFQDARGTLAVTEFTDDLPFRPVRQFVVTGVPAGAVRGQHAHRKLQELLICARGSFSVTLDDGHSRVTVPLDAKGPALHLRSMVWASQHDFSADAVLVVLASRHFETDDYIRDYDTFLKLRRGT